MTRQIKEETSLKEMISLALLIIYNLMFRLTIDRSIQVLIGSVTSVDWLMAFGVVDTCWWRSSSFCLVILLTNISLTHYSNVTQMLEFHRIAWRQESSTSNNEVNSRIHTAVSNVWEMPKRKGWCKKGWAKSKRSLNLMSSSGYRRR